MSDQPETLPTVQTENEQTKAVQQVEQTAKTEFKPTFLMVKWLSKAFEIQSTSPTEIARQFKRNKNGKRRLIWYEWLQVPGFSQWWDDQWRLFYKGRRYEIVEIGMNKAKEDHSWWRDMAELFGFRKPESEMNVPQQQTQINIMTEAFNKAAQERGVQVEPTVSEPVSPTSQG